MDTDPQPFVPQPFDAPALFHKDDVTVHLRANGATGATVNVNSPPDPIEHFALGLRTKRKNDGEPLFSVAEELTFQHKSNRYKARGLACLCERGKAISVTLRSIQGAAAGTPDFQRDTEQPTNVKDLKLKFKAKHDYAKIPNWFSIQDQCEVLDKLIFDDEPHPHGLVVVCGSTNSAKSLIARGLIHMRLEKARNDRKKKRRASTKDRKNNTEQNPAGRRPHLVTFEDPIEDFFVVDDRKTPTPTPATALAAQWGIDYTPRERGKDVRDLAQGFADALRQTPTVFFVGEVREVDDWKTVLEFAATGHLVVTTAHAGSLLEMLMKILAAVGADTPAKRRQYAEKILAVVHMRSFGKDSEKLLKDMKVKKATEQQMSRGLLLPSLWRRRDKGLASLTGTGFGSVMPLGDIPTSLEAANRESCFGYHALFQKLWSVRKDPEDKPTDPIAEIKARLACAARIDDL